MALVAPMRRVPQFEDAFLETLQRESVSLPDRSALVTKDLPLRVKASAIGLSSCARFSPNERQVDEVPSPAVV